MLSRELQPTGWLDGFRLGARLKLLLMDVSVHGYYLYSAGRTVWRYSAKK